MTEVRLSPGVILARPLGATALRTQDRSGHRESRAPTGMSRHLQRWCFVIACAVLSAHCSGDGTRDDLRTDPDPTGHDLRDAGRDLPIDGATFRSAADAHEHDTAGRNRLEAGAGDGAADRGGRDSLGPEPPGTDSSGGEPPSADTGTRDPDAEPRPDAHLAPPDRCPQGAGDHVAAAYEHASDDVHDLREILNLSGRYGVSMAGDHLIASAAAPGFGYPRETALSTRGHIRIPDEAVVRYALLWYTGTLFLKPHDRGPGDYTPDLGGPLDSLEDIRNNAITFSIDGVAFGPFDPGDRTPPNQSEIGSEPQLSTVVFEPSFGPLIGTKASVWGNRLDVTGLFNGAIGDFEMTVDPPERLDISGNDATYHNSGAAAGSSGYSLCSSDASWALLVIYESNNLPPKNLVLYDGDWARAWDYMFFHNGRWQRPRVRLDHAPIRRGARFSIYMASGVPAGVPLPSHPTCTCGCGGQYTLTSEPFGGMMTNEYFTRAHVDPPECADDPMHRDSTQGLTWSTAPGAFPQPMPGNDWTLFQSGDTLTEFPNLYEGHAMPIADGLEPVTHEDDPNAGNDVYHGHPWEGRGRVTYHGAGNAMSLVEVEPHCSRIRNGERISYLYFKGDQKDYFKPQHALSAKWILFETPID